MPPPPKTNPELSLQHVETTTLTNCLEGVLEALFNGSAPAPGCRSTGNGKASVGEYIGRELRELYDDVLAQPVPDRFLSLLNKLESGAISAAEAAGRRGDMD